MELSFIAHNKIGEADALGHSLHTYKIPESIEKELRKNFRLKEEKQYMFSFSKFLSFNSEFHGKIIDYFLQNMVDTYEKYMVYEKQQVASFRFKNKIELDKDQLLFLSCILNKLSLGAYFLACVEILDIDYKLELDYITNYCQSPEYNINLLSKN
jgi:hypothetical protein